MRQEGLNEVGKPNTNRCCAPEAVADARSIANQLGIPFYDIHAESVFKQRVVDQWVDAYARAETPNPCLNCNRSIRFGFLMQKALALGAEYLATGHYANVSAEDETGDGEPKPSFVFGLPSAKRLNRAKTKAMFCMCWGRRIWRGRCSRVAGLPSRKCASWRVSLACLPPSAPDGFVLSHSGRLPRVFNA